MFHQKEEVIQERGGYGIQETEDLEEKKTNGAIKILVMKSRTKAA